MEANKLPLVSVIIPTYKRRNIKTAIDSVLEQDYPNLEIIVVDDNAEYEEYRNFVATVLSDYVRTKTIKLIQNSENMGGALSRNVGIYASHGEYIAFLDDDDWYLQGKISKQVEILMNEEKVSLVYCWSRGESVDGTVIWRNHKCKEENLLFEAMIDDCIASTSLIMCRRKAIYAVGLFDNMPCKQDVFLELKLAANGYYFRCVREELVVYGNVESDFERISNVSQNTVLGFEKCRDYSREHYSELNLKQIRMVEANFSFRLCRVAKQINDKKIFCEEMKNSFRYQRNIRRLVRIIIDYLTF